MSGRPDIQRLRPWLMAIAAAATLLVTTAVAPLPTAAADLVEFEQPSAAVDFPESTTWRQRFRSSGTPVRVELLSRRAGSESWFVQEVPVETLPDGSFQATHVAPGASLPNSRLEYRFRVTPPAGQPEDGPLATLHVKDDRVEWRTASNDRVRLHWHEGGKAFAERALRIADEAVARTAALLGVTETEPIDFFVYGDEEQFRSALGPGTQEFIAGIAVAEIRTLFGRIRPDQIGSDEVARIIGHELVHLVFDTATANPYREAPHWLNEGLATFLTDGYTDDWRQMVAHAIADDMLLPLAAIENGFPRSREDLFYLGYGEGVSAVDFFVRAYGEERLVQLIRSYADGKTDDEAFTAATGDGIDAFEAAWLADLGAARPVARGPRDACPGPTPAAWAGSGETPDTVPMPSAGGLEAACPTRPEAPGGSATPDGQPPEAPGPDGTPGQLAVIGVALLAVALLAVGLLLGRRRGSKAGEPEGGQPAVAEPATSEPEAAQPGTSGIERVEPGAVESEAVGAEDAEPETDRPENAGP